MTTLPAVIHKGGFKLTKVRRLGRAAIYRQHLAGSDPGHDAYEVILAQTRHTNYKGEPVEPYEGYPAADSWGKKGWTFTSFAKAVEKLEKVAKASCAGTASRKNRFHGHRRSPEAGSQLRSRARYPGATISRSRIGQSRQTPVRRKVRPSSVRCTVAPAI
jgi:hypothetical protein